ncbi:MAG: PKD domain-containing protein, partial [Thermoplasmata archaeon]|nr:PKD domain-containing protein [Thermoplasmata archaeon]
AWYKCDYDIWVWHWGWGPEPMGGALSCWLTSEIETGGDNCQMPMGSWWYNDENYTEAEAEIGIALSGRWSEFDQVMSEAQREVDVEARKLLVDDLQQMVYDSYSENPPYYDLGLYAYSNANFAGWGDWEAHPGRTTSSDLLWVWYDLEPATNVAPIFVSGLQSNYQTLEDDIFSVTVEVEDSDGDELTVNCVWGDGGTVNTTTISGDTTAPQSVTFTHTYTALATGLELEVNVTDGWVGHTVVSRATVDVVAVLDENPVFAPGSPSANPVSPAYVGDDITWSATVSDAETGGEVGEVIKFTWDWDDGTYDVNTQDPASEGASVTDVQVHAWDTEGTYRVTVYAFDGYNDDETNANHNVSVYRDYVILVNTAPTSLNVPAINWEEDLWAPVVGTAIDADPDTLTFTWDWDDGTFNVTTADNTAPGTAVSSNVKHAWTDPGTYTVTLYVDDGMGHNVSATGTATISLAGTNDAPTGLLGAYDPDPAPVGGAVTFTVSAQDADGDGLTFWIDFGDDSEMETASSAGGTTELQSVTFEHTYESEGPFEATISAEDAEFNTTGTMTVEVVVNEPPTLNLQSAYSAVYNQEFTAAPSLCEDPEGDDITVWYDFGDETDMEMGAGIDEYYVGSHTYMTIGSFTMTVYADDGNGNNVSATASVTVTESNLKPTVVRIVKDPALSTYEIGQEITFNVTVKDPEGDTVTVDIDFGDGTSDTEEVETEANTEVTVEFTHAYEEGGVDYTVTVNATDGMDHSDASPASKTTTVVIEPKAADNTALYIALGVIAIVAVLAALLLMKRKKKGQTSEGGGMEGMAPPEPPPSG